MTIKQALIANISIPGIDDNLVEKVLIDNDLTGSTTYASNLKGQVDVCAISALLVALQTQSMSEGGFSVSFNFEAARLKIVSLAKANPDSPISQEALSIYGDKNTVKSVSRW